MKEIFICSCASLEHQIMFWHDKEYDYLHACPHLVTYRGFFKRLWYGLRYAFGYKSRYGAWDELIFDKTDEEELLRFLQSRQKKDIKT